MKACCFNNWRKFFQNILLNTFKVLESCMLIKLMLVNYIAKIRTNLH